MFTKEQLAKINVGNSRGREAGRGPTRTSRLHLGKAWVQSGLFFSLMRFSVTNPYLLRLERPE